MRFTRLETLPDSVRHRGPWQVLSRGEIDALKDEYQQTLKRDGYLVVEQGSARYRRSATSASFQKSSPRALFAARQIAVLIFSQSHVAQSGTRTLSASRRCLQSLSCRKFRAAGSSRLIIGCGDNVGEQCLPLIER